MPAIDYDALAKQAGALSSAPAAAAPVDYAALAKQAGALSSAAPPDDPLALEAAKLRARDLARAGSLINSSDNFTRYPVNPYTGVPTAPPQTINPHEQDGGLFGGVDEGAITLKHGAAQIANAHSARELAGGAHAVVSGAMQSASVPATAVGLVTAPVPTVLGLVGGTLAQNGVTAGLEAAGAPDEYAQLAGDAAGLVGGGAAAHYLPGAMSAGLEALPGARAAAADALRSSAEKNIATAINPTTKVNKALVADKIAPGILDRGITASSLADLQEKAQAGMEKYGAIIDDIFDQHAQAGTTLSPKPIIAALDAEKQDYTVAGVKINPAYVDHLDGLIKQIQSVSDANGGAIPLADLRRIRQIQDETVAKSKGAFALPPDAQSQVAAAKIYANSIRSTFADHVDELAEPNGEFNFYSNLDKVVGDSLLRKTGQRAPLTQKILEGMGTGVGAHVAGAPGALIGKEAGATLGKLQNGALWNTNAALAKSKLADLIEPSSPSIPPPSTGVAPAAAPVAQSNGVNHRGQTTPNSGKQILPVPAANGPGAQVGGGAATPGNGTGTTITVPGQTRNYAANYRLQELDGLQASHNGLTFAPNAEYKLTNDRDYGNAVNQGKVISWASPAEFDPKFHITDNPDATNGPPVVDSEGNVYGGNGRVMIMQRVYNGNPKGAAEYRSLLQQKAAQFGIDPAQVSAMKKPVLVREVPDSEFLKPGQSKQDAVTDFNKKGTAELTPGERAIADSRRVSPGTLDDIAARLDEKGPDATLADVLEGPAGVEILNHLIKDGVVSPQERAALTSESKLTPAGKDRVSKLMLGRFFRDPSQLDTLAPSLRNKVERIAAPLSQVEGRADWNLTPDVQTAVDILHQAQAHGLKNVDDFLRQDGLFGEHKYGVRAVALAKAMQRMKQTDLAAAFRQYAQDSNYASKGANTLLGDAPTPESAFEEAFQPSKNALAS